MKYWRGYLVAGIFAAFTWALTRLGEGLSDLIDMVYPYITRTIQSSLAQWSGGVDVCLWQVAVVALIVLALASVVLMIILRWNPIQWLGWVLAVVSIGFFCHTLMYGLNQYAGPLSQDIRLEEVDVTLSQLEDATIYFRDQANALAPKIPRDEAGDAQFDDFETLAAQAGEGFQVLTYDRYLAVFAGSTAPVKKLGWADLYASMGITGISIPFTGESAVNPDIPPASLPFTMCHEMAHRMCIAREEDANLAAFLASQSNPDIQFQYSAYYMAYRYCYLALASVGTSDASETVARIRAGENDELAHDMRTYSQFFSSRRNETATKVATTTNDTYLKASGDKQGVASYDRVYRWLVSWYLQEIVEPTKPDDAENRFDPLTVDPYAPLPTEEAEETEATENDG